MTGIRSRRRRDSRRVSRSRRIDERAGPSRGESPTERGRNFIQATLHRVVVLPPARRTPTRCALREFWAIGCSIRARPPRQVSGIAAKRSALQAGGPSSSRGAPRRQAKKSRARGRGTASPNPCLMAASPYLVPRDPASHHAEVVRGRSVQPAFGKTSRVATPIPPWSGPRFPFGVHCPRRRGLRRPSPVGIADRWRRGSRPLRRAP